MTVSLLALALALTGCQDQATLDENARLKQRVADLERANKRLETDNVALSSKAKEEAAAAEKAKKAAAWEALGLHGDQRLHATFVTTFGDIHCTLRHEQAPETVMNFVQLAKGEKTWTDPRTGQESNAPLYDGTIFHRVMPGFMIQGGDPLGQGTGGPGYQFADEVGEFSLFDHPGILAMANSGPNSNGSQFFITEGTPDHLNGKHTIFGDCDDPDVVKKITHTETGPRNRPVTEVVLKSVQISVK